MMDLVDLFRRMGRDFLDVHAAFARGHQRHSLRGTIDDHADIEFLGDVGALFDQQSPHLLPAGSGLVRDQLHAEDLGGTLLDLIDRTREFHAAALAASAGVDLGLDDPDRPTERLRRLDGLVDRERGDAARHRHTEAPEDVLALILVDLHWVVPSLIGIGFAGAMPFFFVSCHRG